MKMQLKLATFLTLLIFISSCQQEDIEEEVGSNEDRTSFQGVNLTSDVVYGSSTTQGGITDDLLMDIYEPPTERNSDRPLVILAHGGGFFVGNKADMSDLAAYLANAGFVVASIKYRLVDVEESPTVMRKSVIDAVHDMRAAIRFLRKESNVYAIDDSNIFVGGYSAGAFMALHTAYMNTEAEVIEIGDEPLLDYLNANGGVEGNSGNPEYSSSVKGSISLAGALAKSSFIDAGEPVLYSFHGTDDQVVPYLAGESDGSGVSTEGPGLYHLVAEEVGIINRLYTVEGGAHDTFWETNGAYEDLLNFLSAQL